MRAKVRSTQALRRAFDGLPAALEPIEAAPGVQDAEFRVRLAGRAYRLRARWIGEGWPSEVKRATSGLDREWPRDLVATARRFSKGALETLSALDANWADESGRSRIIRPPGIAIVKERTRDRDRVGTTHRVRWSPSAMGVAEAILQLRIEDPSRELQLRTGELAARTNWSPSQVSQVLQGFDAAGWTAPRGGRSGKLAWRELADPAALLDAWAQYAGPRTFRVLQGHVAARDLVRFAHMQLGPALHGRGIRWALTGWAGLELLAPFATTTPLLQAYVAADDFDTALRSAIHEVNIRLVTEGARVEFRAADFAIISQIAHPPMDPSVLVASTPRVYSDLLVMGGRAADAAAHLREVKIGF